MNFENSHTMIRRLDHLTNLMRRDMERMGRIWYQDLPYSNDEQKEDLDRELMSQYRPHLDRIVRFCEEQIDLIDQAQELAEIS